MGTRSEIDQSHSELDLRMTEGDSLAFQFWVRDADDWAGITFVSAVHPETGWTDTPIAEPTVTIAAAYGPDLETQDLMGLNVDITNAVVPDLIHKNSPFLWGMKETGGSTKFGGYLYVEPRLV